MEEKQENQLAEINAMSKVAEALQGLPQESVRRVLLWAADSYGVSPAGKAKFNRQELGGDDFQPDAAISIPSFEDVADLFSLASPATEPDKALVVGYWLQYIEGKTDFDSQSVNRVLKDMGHSIGNITAAFTSLKGRKPQLAMQTKKSGSSQQARKRYKLTLAGKTAVENMLAPSSD